MNVTSPVASEITSVEFNFLSTEEIHAVSVKQIVNPVTFAATASGKPPVPLLGGLYDPALGATESLRQRCSTCHLDYQFCPGHMGHISLPIPIYNVTFFDQLLRLLRATCVYCFHLRLSKAEVDRYACKLTLIQYGLLAEAADLDAMHMQVKKTKAGGLRDEEGPGDDLESEGDEDDIDSFIARRRKFVEKLIHKRGKRSDILNATKITTIADARRQVVKEFMAAIPSVKKCTRCQAHSPVFRADSFSKIFEKPLPAKLQAANSHLGLRRTNAALDRRKPPGKRSKKDQEKEEVAPVDEGITIEDEQEEEESEEEGATERNPAGKLLTNIEVHNTLARLFENEKEITMLLYQPRTVAQKTPKSVTADMFFLHAIPVPPTCFRPPQAAGGEINESASNKGLVKILQDCLAIRDHKERHGDKADSMHRLMQAFVTLQEDVNTFIDSTKSPMQGMAARNVENGIKQALEKKEGLFRKNMMGKRVNFAARSVISPDPNIETSEIGVPLVFAMKLTYPEPVTDENYAKLTEFVINGPDQWPGAVSIEMENGTIQKLPGGTSEDDRLRRKDMAKLLQTPDPLIGDARPKKVLRHLMNNDYVLMNRQPTLHKPSIMGHKARVLQKERTIRMHYANCNTYNADFDGDEMNMHLPQNAAAQAEAREIAATNLQYLVGTSGKPLRGLIQDHLVMAVWLTARDTLFTREEYQQLLYSGLLPEQGNSGSMRVKTIPPAVMKPRQLWTGKQVVTSILENIKPQHFDGLTLFSKSKVPGDRWYEGCEEGEVIFHNGYLACGILDKNQIGPTEFGFVHSVYEVYGPVAAGRLLSILGRLLTKLLHMRAHTCGMDDLRLTPKGNKLRRDTLNQSHVVGRELAVEYVGLKEGAFREKELKSRLEEVYRDENKHRTLDLKANSSTQSFTSKVIRQCLPSGLEKAFPQNSFQAMTVSGAKGSDVNASQISCLLGQQVLEGRRVPVMVSGKTLPCFRPYETDVRAGGYITDRFLTGIRPQEYYFHCMAGREGLIDTAVKTSRSGYLQRCLIKGMEGIKVNYDNTVRDSDGSLIQFLYGEDGLDVAKQRHLNQFKFCAQNANSLLRRATEDYTSPDLQNTLEYLAGALGYDEKAGGRVKKAIKKYQKKKDLAASEITMSELNPTRYLGSVSEKFYQSREKYIEKNSDGVLSKKLQAMAGRDLLPTLGKGEFRTLMDLKYMRSMIDPGEAVGIVAGQSIGEPSTQMTLNTFHLAGHASKNVTLGIPRLREIVMTASAHIATPTMTLNLRPEISEQEAELFVKRCNRLLLAELIDNVSVTERVTTKSKTYTIRLDLFPADEYAEEYSVSKKQVHGVLKGKFMRALDVAIAKALDPKRAKSKALVGKDDAMPEVGEASGPSEEAAAPREREGNDRDDDDDSDDDDEGDASAAKRKNQKVESASYEKPDEGEEAIVQMVDQEATMEEDEGLGESMNEASDTEKEDATSSSMQEKVDSDNVKSFRFDSEGQWCEIEMEYPAEAPKVLMLGIVEKICRETVIHQLPGITSMSKVPASELSKEEQAQGKRKLAVDGINFRAIWDEDSTIDMHSIETNDIACVLRTYGVEACRNNIVKEMDAVFRGHGISVDIRHLNLIADIMTRGGGYSPFNRQGMKSSVSPLMKMSFETTCQFLKDATLEGDIDDLTTPSSRIVLGKLSSVGTGSFDVMVGGL
ncbi:hypothetical protein FN846DRAFT_926797 [Sphaerosporella brunnea]|uniref:DNA-directed RNA polymerase subunit n=1 Tax=Sphaerosporella brunnea TaxID=1250544 RepID=A0A5J5FAP0_9PEZI|nr:hypothetical protein FN846DRAFT_926797 [Sphaerosporella brunnea]